MLHDPLIDCGCDSSECGGLEVFQILANLSILK